MKFISAQMTAIEQCRHAYWDIFCAGSIARNNCALNVNIKYLVTEFNYAKNKIVEIIWRFWYTVTLPNKTITLIMWWKLKSKKPRRQFVKVCRSKTGKRRRVAPLTLRAYILIRSWPFSICSYERFKRSLRKNTARCKHVRWERNTSLVNIMQLSRNWCLVLRAEGLEGLLAGNRNANDAFRKKESKLAMRHDSLWPYLAGVHVEAFNWSISRETVMDLASAFRGNDRGVF